LATIQARGQFTANNFVLDRETGSTLRAILRFQCKRQMLKTSARFLIILVTVGGGFTSFLELAAQLTDSKSANALYFVLLWIGLAAYSLITAAGLIFIHRDRRTRTMLAALVIQIPWFNVPELQYHLSSAAYITLVFGPRLGQAEWDASLDSRVNLKVGSAATGDWNVGINLFALLVLFIWLLYTMEEQGGEH
jgi:hypothetical protein